MRLPQLNSKANLRDFVKRSRFRLFALLTLAILLLLAGLIAWLRTPGVESYRLKASGGVRGLNRHGLIEYFRRHANEIDVHIEVIETEGSVEATQHVHKGLVDLALVNSLMRIKDADEVRQLAAISTEVLHVLVKSELTDAVVSDFTAMKNFSISVGPKGSETEIIAKSVLAFCGIDIHQDRPEGKSQLDRKTIGELLEILDKIDQASPIDSAKMRGTLPDVVMHVSLMPSPLARKLIRQGNYELVPVPFAEAFARVTVEEEDLDRDQVDQVHVIETTIPAYMYSVSPPMPEKDFTTLGSPLILIGHQSLPDDVIARILPRIYYGPIERVYHPPAIEKVAPTYPWHDASITYRDRDKPLVRADVIEVIRQVFSIVAPIVGGCLALFGFYRWRQTLRFLEYFEQFQKLDLEAKGLVRDSQVTPADAEEARRIEGELTILQQQAVSDFCQNYFYGPGVLLNFIELLAETRDFLRTDPASPSIKEESSSDRI